MVDALGQVHIILTYDEYQDLMKYADDNVIEDGIINTIIIRATNSLLSDISEEFKEDIEDICAFSKSQQEFETALFAITTSQKFEEVTK